MLLKEAIALANTLLTGNPAPDGQEDPRWQAVIEVGKYIETDPEPVWQLVLQWGSHSQSDLRDAIATCLLERLLECHFQSLFPRVPAQAQLDPAVADTVRRCWKFGQAAESRNAARFDALLQELAAGPAA